MEDIYSHYNITYFNDFLRNIFSFMLEITELFTKLIKNKRRFENGGIT